MGLITCNHCNKSWNTKSKKEMVCCTSCLRKVKNPHAEIINPLKVEIKPAESESITEKEVEGNGNGKERTGTDEPVRIGLNRI